MRNLSYDGKINPSKAFLHRFSFGKHNKIMKNNKKSKNKFKSKNDPLGSYTGNCLIEETPVQDADDL